MGLIDDRERGWSSVAEPSFDTYTYDNLPSYDNLPPYDNIPPYDNLPDTRRSYKHDFADGSHSGIEIMTCTVPPGTVICM
jgi:hypothetical protein